jgi:hypothetical protein
VSLSFEHASPQIVSALVLPVGPMMESASPASDAS